MPWSPPSPHPTQLEYGTKLVRGQGYWEATLYPEAGEAVAVFHSARKASGEGGDTDPEESERVAVRRARTRIRQYCAANRLNRLGTLTYAGDGCRNAIALARDVARFFRELRRSRGGTAFPYLWTSEWHPKGHGLHVHFAVGQYVGRALIATAWAQGFISIKLLGDLPYSSTSLTQARVAARYLAKYVAKTLDGRGAGLHRYEVAQGFAPRREVERGPTAERVLAWTVERMNRAYSYRSESSSWEGYRGACAVFVSWT